MVAVAVGVVVAVAVGVAVGVVVVVVVAVAVAVVVAVATYGGRASGKRGQISRPSKAECRKTHIMEDNAGGIPPIQTTNLDFGQALNLLKAGRRVRRAGWNGKGMFLFLLPAQDGIPTRVINDPALRAVIESETGKDTFDAYGSIRMWTADKKVLTGWLASQTDMLSNDWELVS